MAGGYEPDGRAPVAHDGIAASDGGSAAFDAGGAFDPGGAFDSGGAFDPETIELIAQIRQLAAEDPNGVQQIVTEVLAALDRVTGSTVREP